jgi:hypothetical protein
MAANLSSVCGGSVWIIHHEEFGQLGTLSQSPDWDGLYVLTLKVPTKWREARHSIMVEERGHETHKFKTRTEAREYMVKRFWTKFANWN